MYNKRKILIIAVLSGCLAVIALFMGRFEKREIKPQLPGLILPEGTEIYPWTDENEDVSYYFIPSFAELDDIHLSMDEDNRIKIDERLFSNGDSLLELTPDQDYVMTGRDNIEHKVRFIRSGNVSTIFVSTATGSIDPVLRSKDHKEIAKITVVDKDGNIDLAKTDSKIKGRGNSTWKKDKKPFTILFNEPESILGMAVSSKWALLANAYDHSGIRNALVFDTARDAGLIGTPEYEYADLYINGLYNGLYLICQTADTFIERTDVDEENVYLFTAEVNIRAEEVSYPIYAENDEVIIDVHLPKKLSSYEKETAKDIISKIDTTIDNGGSDISEVIDIDSWAKRYLIDEIFANYDSGVTSSYFYITEGSDSKAYAGPVWDYDNILGNRNAFARNINPETLYAQQQYRSKTQRILWYSKLYSNPIFYDAVVNLFEEVFLPRLELLLNNDILQLDTEIRTAKKADDLRWGFDTDGEYDQIREFLLKRIQFLKKIWLDNSDYVRVTYYTPDNNSLFMSFFIPRGSSLSNDPNAMGEFEGTGEWCIDGTEEKYDFDLPVNEDIVLVNASFKEQPASDSITANNSINKKLVIIGISIIFMLFLAFLLWLTKDVIKGIFRKVIK